MPSSSWPTTARACSSATARRRPTRGEWLRDRLGKESPWKTRLEQDFDVRRYAFDSHLRAVDGFDTLDLRRRRLLADDRALSPSRSGSAACRSPACWSSPTAVGPTPATSTGRSSRRSIPSCPRRGASPGTSASAASRSARPTSRRRRSWSAPTSRRPATAGSPSSPSITDEAGKDVERQEAVATRTTSRSSFRFQFRPEKKGISFYRVRAFARDEEQPPGTRPARSATGEQTLGQQQPAGRRRSGGRPVSGAVRQRPAQLGVQVPAAGPRRRRPGRHRRPASASPASSRSSTSATRGAASTSPFFDGFDQRRPRDGRTVRPAGARPVRHPRRGRAARRLPQVGRGALSAITRSSSTTWSPPSSRPTSSPSCGTS